MAVQRGDYWGSCYGKRAYPTRAEARAAKHRLHREGVRGLVMYRCWWCDGWIHLGHSAGLVVALGGVVSRAGARQEVVS